MSKINLAVVKAVIFGLAGTELSDAERDFFTKNNPFGFILFKRNCKNPEQIKKLVAELRLLTGRKDTPILIDQEGGRVARLKPPHWRDSPPAGIFANIAKYDLERAKQAVYLNTRLIASELADLGITVDCAPVADIFYPNAHDIVGDRAYGNNPQIVASMAAEVCRGLLEGGIMPVVKHIPGHGRSDQDSHEALPVVTASKAELDQTDFFVFKKLASMPWAMTAHIKYQALDNKEPATLSKKIVKMIRDEIGFDGVLLTDDISMKALSESFRSRCEKSLEAGCDIVLHCNGEMREMIEIAKSVGGISKKTAERIENAGSQLNPKQDDFNFRQWEMDLASLLSSDERKTSQV